MEHYSIESEIDHIYDSRTKDYFQEVFSSYNNGNYRSAVVMLWSVVICDLVYKLQHLRDIDSDSISASILQTIETKQKNNPKSPDWELDLLKQVKEKTELLDIAEYQSLIHLQETRHLSAHPVLGSSDLLFRPNKDAARALIRGALESVLLKPPILTQKVVEKMVVDLSAKKDVLIDDASLKRYLEARFLKNLRPATEAHVFRALWKFVFRLKNEDADRNRNINFRALKVLYARNPSGLKNYIEGHKDYFSDVGGEELLGFLMQFLCENPSVYFLLADSAKVLVQNLASSNLNDFAKAYFLSPSLQDHLNKVLKKIADTGRTCDFDGTMIRGTTVMALLNNAADPVSQSLVIDIAIQSYVRSANYNDADIACTELVLPLISSMNRQQLEKLLSGVETNHETYRRKQAKLDHRSIKDYCDEQGIIDTSQYPNFYRSAT